MTEHERLSHYLGLMLQPGWRLLVEEMEEAVKILRWNAIDSKDIDRVRGEVRAMERVIHLQSTTRNQLDELEKPEQENDDFY